jgi:hypothetical protein
MIVVSFQLPDHPERHQTAAHPAVRLGRLRHRHLLLPAVSRPGLPITLFGSVLALILGFRSTSAYQRWWEGRGLWGLMINANRNLARGARSCLTHMGWPAPSCCVRWPM